MSYFVHQKQIVGDLKTYLPIEMSQNNTNISNSFIHSQSGEVDFNLKKYSHNLLTIIWKLIDMLIKTIN